MRSALFAFILLSALIHIFVLYLSEDRTLDPQQIKEQGGSLIHINLTPHIIRTKAITNRPVTAATSIDKPIATNTESTTKQDTKPESFKKNNSESKSIINKETAVKDNSIEHIKPTQTGPPAVTPDRNNKEKITQVLKTELAKHFYYPRSAIRRQRQGKVILSFEISSQGFINNIQIKESSGHKILDNAAIHSIKKIDVNTELEHLLSASTSTVSLPVIYNLNN